MMVKLDDTFYLHIGTSAPSTGAATDADSTPTVSVEEDGVAMGYSPAVANVTTGLYRVTIVCSTANGFEAGKRYSVYAVATVGGVTGRDGIAEFAVNTKDVDSKVVVSSIDDDVIQENTFNAGVSPTDALAAYGPAVPGSAMTLTGAYDAAKTAAQAGDAMTLTGAYDAAKTASQAGDAMTLTGLAVDAILDDVVEGSYTMRHLLRLMAASLVGKVSGGGSATVVFRAADDSKDRITATIDIDGNRTAVTLDET
jgi:hypothetical protein